MKTAKEWTTLSSQVAMAVKKAKKAKKDNVAINTEQAEEAAKGCMAIARLVKLAEKDAELADPEERLVGAAAGRAAVWGMVMQELDELV
jgi:hypothetical protein